MYKSKNLFEPVTNAICKQTGKKEKNVDYYNPIIDLLVP